MSATLAPRKDGSGAGRAERRAPPDNRDDTSIKRVATSRVGAWHTRAVRWTLDQIAEATGGRVEGETSGESVRESAVVDGVTQDSREVRPGMLFVPLVADRDGHDFIEHAVTAGASAYLTARDATVAGAPAVVVPDTSRALRDLAAQARRRLGDLPVVGITGSVGKTTTKDLLAAVLGRSKRVWASRRSFNNEIGVPITLVSAPEDTEVLVVEMGARGAGHIAGLCALARPSLGVVTTVGLAHTSEFGSLHEVVAAKRELVEALPAAQEGGVALLNADVPEVVSMAASTRARVVTFGAGGDVTAAGLTLDEELTTRFTLTSPRGDVEVVLGARGAQSVGNALAAAAAALELGVPLDDVAAGLADPVLSPLRMELVRTASGARLLNDCYNANPLSMRAALHALAALPAQRRIAVLGPMAELGEFEAAEHAAVGSLATQLGVQVVAVNASGYGRRSDQVMEADDVDAALDALHALGGLGPQDAVLVKGSRVAELEHLVERLTGR